MRQLRLLVFRLFERRRLRDWFYTVAFIVSVPVGLRFAILAWRYGSWVDKPLAVVAGGFIGVTAVVTLLRFWEVPPQLVASQDVEAPAEVRPDVPHAGDLMSAARQRAAANRAMAMGAGVLGSTTGRRW
jgi:hypothetical protein